jgi:hypothetical protein
LWGFGFYICQNEIKVIILLHMLDNFYEVGISEDFQTFEFESVGIKGKITKVVRFSEINVKGYYNLGFGDKDPITNFISDLTVSNNGDSQKVLATVAAILFAFTDRYPEATVIDTRSTETRTRLY